MSEGGESSHSLLTAPTIVVGGDDVTTHAAAVSSQQQAAADQQQHSSLTSVGPPPPPQRRSTATREEILAGRGGANAEENGDGGDGEEAFAGDDAEADADQHDNYLNGDGGDEEDHHHGHHVVDHHEGGGAAVNMNNAHHSAGDGDGEDGDEEEYIEDEIERFKNAHLHALSPTVRKLAEEAQRKAEADEAADEEDEEDDYYDDEYYANLQQNLTGGGVTSGKGAAPQLTLDLAERVFRDITARCDEGSGPGKPSIVRTAAACLLLEQLCAQYPQYVTILTAISDVIMKSVFVPDTAEMRHLLGTVRRGVRLPPDLNAKYGRLLRPYARKTYAEAHAQLSEGLLSHAKANRNIELRLTRQTNIFERTVKHWSSSVLRNHFVVWRQHTRRRKQIREKYRTIFGRMRTDECRVKAIRAWRDRAAKMKRLAMFDTASIAELEGIQGSTEKMMEQITALQDYNNNLSSQIVELERDRQILQSDISAKERVVVELSLRAKDMGRVGTQLLDTAIVKRPPPEGANPLDILVEWASQMVDASGGMLDGTRNVLRPLRNADIDGGNNGVGGGSSAAVGVGGSSGGAGNSGSVVNIPLPAFGLVMLGFNDERAPSREQVVQLHTLKDSRHVAKELVNMCVRLTAAPSLVTPDQLFSRQRPMLLLFLSSLFRHYTNYILNRPLPNVGGDVPATSPFAQVGAAMAAAASAANGGGGSNSPRSRATFADDHQQQQQQNQNGADSNAQSMITNFNNNSVRSVGTAVGGIIPEEEDPEAQASEAVGQWAERVVYQQQWITVSMAALHSALDVALQKPIQLSSEEQEDLGKFYNVPMSKLSDILPNGVGDTFYVTFFRSLTRIYPDLRRVYSAYATPTLSYHDLIRLLKDCKLLGPKRFQRSQIVLLMLSVLGINPDSFGSKRLHHNTTNGAHSSDGQKNTGTSGSLHPTASSASLLSRHKSNMSTLSDDSGDPTKEGRQQKGGAGSAATAAHAQEEPVITSNGAPLPPQHPPSILTFITAEDCNQLELSPASFTETIIRLALAHVRKTQRDNSLLLSSSAIVSNFVLENIVPNALRSDVDRFKHVFRHPLVQAVIARHKIALRRAFHKYAADDGGEGMNLACFQKMAKDGRWGGKRITDEALHDVFGRCQQDNGGSFDTLDLYEWLEAICALAIYDNPNPLVPLHAKLGPFVEEKVLSVLIL